MMNIYVTKINFFNVPLILVKYKNCKEMKK